MYEVRISKEARQQFAGLPLSIQALVQTVFGRLTRWPEVSGAKPLRHELKGACSGPYR